MLECSTLSSNHSNQTSVTFSDEYFRDIHYLNFVAYGIVGFIVITLGIVGNVLNMVVLSRPSLQGVTFTYLSWLATSDLMTLIFSTTSLIRLQNAQPKLYVSAFYFSHVELVIVNAFMASSVFIVVSVTVDRYFSVCHPTRFRQVHNKTQAKRAIFCAYVVAFLIYIPICFEKSPVEIGNTLGNKSAQYVACENPDIVNNPAFKVFLLFKEIIVRIGPVIVLGVLNVNIILTFCRHHQNFAFRTCSKKKIQDERKLVVLLAGIVILFFICMTPAAILTLLHSEDKDSDYDFQVFRAVANILELANYSLNFYVYCLCSPEIRYTLFNIFTTSTFDTSFRSRFSTRITNV